MGARYPLNFDRAGMVTGCLFLNQVTYAGTKSKSPQIVLRCQNREVVIFIYKDGMVDSTRGKNMTGKRWDF